LTPLAPLFHRATKLVRWGEHRAGMFVRVSGQVADGTSVHRSWHLVAEGDDGPFIPSMAVAAVVRRTLAGQRPEAGARTAARELELADYQPMLAARRIRTGRREEMATSEQPPLYYRLLGDAWNALPAAVRAMHSADTAGAEGIATVERGSGWLSRLVAALFRFPKTDAHIPLSVSFARQGGREIWRRHFRSRAFSSVQTAGARRWDRLLVERFGPFSVALALVVDGDSLSFVSRGWRFFGLPLPAILRPRGHSYEREQDGSFVFQAEITHPLTGLIVRYRGALTPRATAVPAPPHVGD
jgi:Domain of unknown function (DUF4166)